MDPNFWRQRWEKHETGWHERQPNPLLVRYFNELALAQRSRLFLPLCGKTLDISWLLSRGYRAAGAELSQLAIEELFMELGLQPEIAPAGGVEQWSAKNVDIFVGDIFKLSRKTLGAVDGVYDRAALVALPPEMRGRYTAHLMEITNAAPQLLICYEYDQKAMDGPPFSISAEEVNRHYRDAYEPALLATVPVSGGLKGQCAAQEHVWLLRPQRR